MIPEINYWAVLVVMVSSMIVGSVWYMPSVFGRRWAKLAGVDIADPKKTAAQAGTSTRDRSSSRRWGRRCCCGRASRPPAGI